MWVRIVFIQQFLASFRLICVGLICLSYSYGVLANQTSELNGKLFKAISRNDFIEVQRFVGEGASPEASNASGLSAIDIAVDNGFYDIAHFLIEANKKKLQAIPASSSTQVLNSEPSSIIDKIGNFFKSEPSVVAKTKSNSKLSVTPKTSTVNTSPFGFNLFTQLTDTILDFLPDNFSNAPQPLHIVKQPGLHASKRAEDEKVIYPVIDYTILTKNPYEIEKIDQTNILPLVKKEDKPTPNYIAETVSSGVSKLPSSMPRNLKQSDLVFGGRGRLGDLFEATDVNAESCIIKSSWKSFFCIESFTWPSEIQNALGNFGGLVGNGHSIVHYLNGESVQFHGLFPSNSFGIIASLLTRDLGAPTEAPTVMTSMLAEAELPNIVFKWIAPEVDDQPPIILEIRKIDDLRWSLPPDRLNGVIRMYRQGESSVFKILTAADLLLLQIRKGGQQKTLPVN
jgi:hypothetical protein